MSPKILIVDDLPLNVQLLEAVLQSEGFETCSADSGFTGLAMSRSERPDLILLDVMMPGESGFETCAKLKSDPVTADIPVIFLSALDDVKNKVKGLKIGGVDYISKPVHGEEVLARVRVHLRIGENNRAVAREHQTRLEDLRNAQQAILVRPEDCSRRERPRRTCCFPDVGDQSFAATVFRPTLLARRHHARGGLGHASDARRRAIPYCLLCALEPADKKAFRGECRTPAIDHRKQFGKIADDSNGQRSAGHFQLARLTAKGS